MTSSAPAASTSTTSSVLPGDVSSVYLHLAGADSAKDLFGNFSQIAFTLDIESLNCSGSIDYTTSFSIVGHPVVNGSRTTQVNGTDQVQSAGCMQGNPAALSQAYSILMSPNGTVIQVYRNDQAMGGSMLDDFGLATIIVSADGAYNFAITLLQNTTYFQEANSSSTTLGSAHLSVTSYAATPTFASLYLGSDLGSESVNIGTVQGATLYVPTYGIRTYLGTIDDSPSWLQTTLNLTSIATG